VPGRDIVGKIFANNDRGILLAASSHNVISRDEVDNSESACVNAGVASDRNTIDSNVVNGVSIGSISDTSSSGILITGGDYNAITHDLVKGAVGPGINLNNRLPNISDAGIGNAISYTSVVDANDSPHPRQASHWRRFTRTDANRGKG
jgi:hypothetical protein